MINVSFARQVLPWRRKLSFITRAYVGNLSEYLIFYIYILMISSLRKQPSMPQHCTLTRRQHLKWLSLKTCHPRLSHVLRRLVCLLIILALHLWGQQPPPYLRKTWWVITSWSEQLDRGRLERSSLHKGWEVIAWWELSWYYNFLMLWFLNYFVGCNKEYSEKEC